MKLAEIFAANVKRLLASQDPPWPQLRLAEKSGIRPQHINTMLKGEVFPGEDRLQKIADAFGIKPKELLTDPNEPAEDKPAVLVPLLGPVGAGGGKDDPREPGETFDVSARCNGTTAVTVRGESMIRAGVYDSDVVMIRPKDKYEPGERVVAWVDDEQGHVLKQLAYKKNAFYLVPYSANDSTKFPILLDDDKTRIIGAVVAIFPGDPSPSRASRNRPAGKPKR